MAPNRTEPEAPAQTIFEDFERAADRFADNAALVAEGGLGTSYSYREVLDLSTRLAAGLQSPGLSELRQIGLLSENRPEWAVAYLAIVGSGKTVVPIDANLRPGEMEAIFRHAGLKTVLTSARFEPVIDNFDRDIALYSFDQSSSRSWESLMGNPVDFTPVGSPETLAVLIYTSGTTGAPKAVMLTHRNILSNLIGIRKAIYFDENDSFLSLLPLHHTFETTAGFLTPITSGGKIVYGRSYKSRDVVEDLGRNGITVLCGVPLLYEKIYQSMHRKLQSAPMIRRALFRSLFAMSALGWKLKMRWGRGLFAALRKKAGMDRVRIFVSGAAPMPPHISRFFTLLGVDFVQGYGLTETSPCISVNRLGNIRFNSVGPPLDGVEVKIDQPDSLGIGEILVRGDNCTSGYKGNPEQTAELLKDGWLYTGDLGKLERGHLYITGRAKNLIVSAAGKNIYPEELEEKLMASDYILESIVFGRLKEGRQGEDVRALIVPDLEQLKSEFGIDPENPNRDTVMDVLKNVVAETNAEMAEYKRIVAFDMQFEELEKTSTKKVKRFIYH
jgi:long-chain acyl-CoA synthetase